MSEIATITRIYNPNCTLDINGNPTGKDIYQIFVNGQLKREFEYSDEAELYCLKNNYETSRQY